MDYWWNCKDRKSKLRLLHLLSTKVVLLPSHNWLNLPSPCPFLFSFHRPTKVFQSLTPESRLHTLVCVYVWWSVCERQSEGKDRGFEGWRLKGSLCYIHWTDQQRNWTLLSAPLVIHFVPEEKKTLTSRNNHIYINLKVVHSWIPLPDTFPLLRYFSEFSASLFTKSYFYSWH